MNPKLYNSKCSTRYKYIHTCDLLHISNSGGAWRYVASGEADRELSSQADVNFMQDGGRHKVLIRGGSKAPQMSVKTVCTCQKT